MAAHAVAEEVGNNLAACRLAMLARSERALAAYGVDHIRPGRNEPRPEDARHVRIYDKRHIRVIEKPRPDRQEVGKERPLALDRLRVGRVLVDATALARVRPRVALSEHGEQRLAVAVRVVCSTGPVAQRSIAIAVTLSFWQALTHSGIADCPVDVAPGRVRAVARLWCQFGSKSGRRASMRASVRPSRSRSTIASSVVSGLPPRVLSVRPSGMCSCSTIGDTVAPFRRPRIFFARLAAVVTMGCARRTVKPPPAIPRAAT